ncbi:MULTISPECIES: phosphatidate cytidylyltransferase [Enorma]|nr:MULTISPECIES: phosphatidate cytidylyltransferase [Enorma]
MAATEEDMAKGGESTTVTPSEAADRRSFKGLSVRVASAAVYAVLFIGCILAGTIPCALFIALLSGLCAHEFFQMVRRDGKMPNEIIGDIAAVLFPLAALGDSVLLTALIFLFMLSLGLWYVYTPRARIADVAATLMGAVYTGFMLSSIVLLRDALPGWAGAVLTIGVCASLWVSDSFAYLVGKAIGRHKMAPRISPKKTWEGFVGGIVGSIIVWLILFATGLFTFDAFFAVVCGAAVAVLGVIGDLIESRIKRAVGVKDSGHLIPGHGGMLDRCDSLIFGCITAQLLLHIGGVL